MPKPKQILNDAQNAVDDYIDGLLLQYPNHLKKLANHHVILRASLFQKTSLEDQEQSMKVHLLSGGGSGHEPSHAGWIGQGMLTGVICGGIFASPSVSSISAAIRVVAHAAGKDCGGILLIVKNYTGDRLNFGMAVERANEEGIPAVMVVVADDCALPRTKGITGARGLAGTVLVHKIAGAAAATGKTLEEVANLAKQAASLCGTLGIALNSVTVPGSAETNERLDEHTIEIGLGIHGEAGMKQSPLLTSDEMAREMVTAIQNHGRVVSDKLGNEMVEPLFKAGDDVCVLVNNLGGTSNFEMSILAKSCITLLESNEFQVRSRRVFVGSFMTSFDMHGVSLTILNLSGQPELMALLDAPTDAPAWNACDIWYSSDVDNMRPSSIDIPEVVAEKLATLEVALLPSLAINSFETIALAAAKNAVTKLSDAEPLLTKYDTIVGDGDCGITMQRGATEIQTRLQNGTCITVHPIPMFFGLADAVSASMGGTSGILLEMMLRKMGSTLSREKAIGLEELCYAFQAGVDAVCLYGGAQVGSRTMLDALVPAAKVLLEAKDIALASVHARNGADSTAQMKVASAGRSNYLSEKTLAGTPDPGAVAVAIVLEALAESCKTE